MSDLINCFGQAKPSELTHNWLNALPSDDKARINWVFSQFFQALKQLKASVFSDIDKTRYDWLSGYFEYLRLQTDTSLAARALKAILGKSTLS